MKEGISVDIDTLEGTEMDEAKEKDTRKANDKTWTNRSVCNIGTTMCTALLSPKSHHELELALMMVMLPVTPSRNIMVTYTLYEVCNETNAIFTPCMKVQQEPSHRKLI